MSPVTPSELALAALIWLAGRVDRTGPAAPPGRRAGRRFVRRRTVLGAAGLGAASGGIGNRSRSSPTPPRSSLAPRARARVAPLPAGAAVRPVRADGGWRLVTAPADAPAGCRPTRWRRSASSFRPMPRRIAILPDAVADQIAAGEVVERPASVVKELVENALDAGARHVRVSWRTAARRRIEVSDDGSGMSRDDAVLAVDRHATSKIRSAGDLVGVADLRLPRRGAPGHRLGLPLRARDQQKATAPPPSLRLPAAGWTAWPMPRASAAPRLRCVRCSSTPRAPQVSPFVGERNAGRSRGASPPSRWPTRSAASSSRWSGGAGCTCHPARRPCERLAAVWGRDLAGTLVPVHYARGPFRVEGYAQRPGDARPTGRRTQLFVNGRPFRDPFLVRAAEAGYRAAIHPGDRPSLFLDIGVDPPRWTSTCIRPSWRCGFASASRLERAVEEAVRDAIGALVAAAPVGDWRPLPLAAGGTDGLAWADANMPLEWPTSRRRPTRRAGEAPGRARVQHAAPAALRHLHPVPGARRRRDRRSALGARAGAVRARDGAARAGGRGGAAAAAAHHARAHRRGARCGGAHRRGARAGRLRGGAVRRAQRHAAYGARRCIRASTRARCFREMVADLARGRFGGWANRLERFAATFACRAAVKAGDRSTQAEMRELLLQLFATDLPPHDVHGRSTIVQLPREELERRFGRR